LQRLILTSKSACFTTVPPPPAEDEGLSAGATFLVLFFTLFSAYFFGGMAVLKFIKGAQGFEMIPNYEFWTGLPSLVKVNIKINLHYLSLFFIKLQIMVF